MNHGQSPLFPPAYAPWLKARLGRTATENLATCDSCAMVKPEGVTRDPGPFLENLKCCTYFPFVPNFGLGAMYSRPSAALKLRLRTASDKGIMLPQGLFSSPEHQLLIEELGDEGFGRKPELLCPFFDTSSSNCSVWENRPAVCTTYFCKSNRGADGLHFWGEVERYLNHFEWTLANEVLNRIGFTDEQFEMSKAVMTIEEAGQERDYFARAAWGAWYDKQIEFYSETKRVALEISSIDIGHLIDPEFLELEAELLAQLPMT